MANAAKRKGPRKPGVFLSYSRKDDALASDIEKALNDLDIPVWRDVRSVSAGTRWFDAIERGIRDSRGLIVLVTAAGGESEWVNYEYAFATGARVPVVAVVAGRARVPEPMRGFQMVKFTNASKAAKSIEEAIDGLARSLAAEARAATPTLMAKFYEEDGELVRLGGRIPSWCLELWMEHVPPSTRRVAFEILDSGFDDPKWTQSRGTDVSRQFLTDDMNSYGDVELWIRGMGPGAGSWSATSRLYDALLRYYGGRPQSREVRRALKQIREY